MFCIHLQLYINSHCSNQDSFPLFLREARVCSLQWADHGACARQGFFRPDSNVLSSFRLKFVRMGKVPPTYYGFFSQVQVEA